MALIARTMAKTPQAIRGTQDIFGADAEAFAFVVETFERVRKLFRFRRVEMPVFEKTEVFSRAIGETMIVVMAAGLAANLTANPFAAVTTVTVQIVTLLVGDQEFDSAKTLAAFALGLVLFAITLALNIVALMTVRKYREQYD